MNCPNCGAEVLSDNEKFCRKCGFKLVDSEVKKATVISEDIPKTRCRSCNNMIDSNLRICPTADQIQIHLQHMHHQHPKQTAAAQVTVTAGDAVV